MRSVICALVTTLSLVSTASADIVARYDFTGNVGKEAFEAPVFEALHVDATNLIRGPGLQLDTAVNSFAAKNWSGPEGTDYFGFSIAPEAGYVIDLTSIDLGTLTTFNPHPSNHFELLSSLDNFATSLGSATLTTTPTAQTITFGTPLSVTGQVFFRLVAYGNTANGQFTALTNQNGTPGLVLNGTISPAAVPEPTSIALLALTGLGTVGVRSLRQRRSKSA